MGSFMIDILELAVAIELECAGVYEVFARRFSTDDDLSTFWRLYAEAERYHGATIRIHQATFGREPIEGDLFPTEVDESRRFLEQLRAWRKDFEQRAPTRAEAFEVARRIESSTAELHGRTQFFKLYPRFQELFARMVEEDLGHRDMLSDAEKKFALAG